MSEWISISDRLPEVGQKVLAYRPTAHLHGDDPITNCIYEGRPNTSWDGVVHGFDRINHPTHWMPFPEAPISIDTSGYPDEIDRALIALHNNAEKVQACDPTEGMLLLIIDDLRQIWDIDDSRPSEQGDKEL